jgi:hypothetical protein
VTVNEMLKAMKLSLEAALRGVSLLRPAGTPPPNVDVVWHTGSDTAKELLDYINRINRIPTSECDKMVRVRPESQAIGEFLNWMRHEKNYVIAQYGPSQSDGLEPVYLNIEKTLAEFFDIDLQKVEQERQDILLHLRAAHEIEDGKRPA